ncbi:hypothetical protein PFLUV_G00124070 [Perca fluviatilis]|uniref:Uncharacterized protein n=1 Tax=Perca fluviatilis TaxID=8168 RepID=A0A6A5F3K0_PERFL|nr:hypothetical protein PFLUV_G00124070 [Perca fluviatilis]
MDVTEENMTPTEMLEKITELDYAQSQQRDLNAKMRQLLDVADDDIAVLRSENANLRKQVKALEKNISEAQKVEAEPCSSLLADDINAKRCSEQKIQKLEKEYTTIKEHNKKLTTELKSLQQERDQDKIGLSRFKVSLQTLERSMGEAQLELLKRDEVIHQDLRLTNQKLSEQLENRLDEASL